MREHICVKHDHTFSQILIFRLPEVWAPQCYKCEAEERLLRQARSILEQREPEKRRRLLERHKPTDAEIESRTDAIIQARAQNIVDEMESHWVRARCDEKR
jgi:hypothetical protein